MNIKEWKANEGPGCDADPLSQEVLWKYKIRYIDPDVSYHDHEVMVGDRIRLIFVRDGVEVDQVDMERGSEGAREVVAEIDYSDTHPEDEAWSTPTA